MSERILISNARLVNEDQQREVDIRIAGGRIEAIASGLSAQAGEQVVDVAGDVILPGMIDDQVHFREPGMPHKADIRSESAAALAGGITSYMEMPNTQPQTTTLDALDDKYQRAADHSHANYAFYLGATNDNLSVIQSLPADAACGIKIFMGASTGNMLVDDETVLDAIFRDAPVLIATHCESSPMIAANLEQAMARWGREIPVTEHPKIRSREACMASSRLAIELARRHDADLHVLHLSTAEELDLFEPGPIAGKKITAEACTHFLFFDENDYPRLGNRIKCNPAIKSASDKAAIIAALNDGRLNIIATDNAPHTLEEKNSTDYLTAPAGLPLVQFALPVVLELVSSGQLSLEQVTRLTAHNVCDRFNVIERGYVREGWWADLVRVRQQQAEPVADSDLLSICGWSPFEGHRFSWQVVQTWVSGQTGWADGRVNSACRGQRLGFDRR